MDPVNPIIGSTEPKEFPNQEQTMPNKNSSNSLTVISMAVFVLMSLAVVGFLYYQNQQLKEIIANYPTPTASIFPSNIPSPTTEATSSASPKSSPKISPKPVLTVKPSSIPKACTMEAKICPDGSAVGRSGPTCEFAPCPTP